MLKKTGSCRAYVYLTNPFMYSLLWLSGHHKEHMCYHLLRLLRCSVQKQRSKWLCTGPSEMEPNEIFLYCVTKVLYPVKIYHLHWFSKMLIGQQPGRKQRWNAQNRRILRRGKVHSAVVTQTQRRQGENASLIKGTKPCG